jgi:Ca-activated chloride channel family protein
MISNANGSVRSAIVIFVLSLYIAVAGGTALAQSGYNKSKVQPDTPPAPTATGPGTAKQGSGAKQDGALKLSATLVNVAAIVTDHSGQFVPKLTKDDFVLSEDGTAQQIAFFGNEEVPLNIAMLIDLSQSVSSSLKDIKKAAVQFVKALRPNDRVMVVGFDQRVTYLTDFINDPKQLESAINGCQTGRGTSVYEAIYETVSKRFRGTQGRKVILLLSDGDDTTSQNVTYDQTIEKVAQSDVLVYGIRYPESNHGNWGHGGPFGGHRFPFMESTGTAEAGDGQWGGQQGPNGQHGHYGGHQRRDPRDFMKDVTDAGGGPVYNAKAMDDLAKLAPKIADELRHVYTIGYYPSKPLSDGGYRNIDLKVKGHDDLSVRHRQGYDPGKASPQTAS